MNEPHESWSPPPGDRQTGVVRLSVMRHVRTGVIGATLASNLFALALPLVLLQAYDRIIPNQATATLSWLIVALVVVLILDAVVRVVRASTMAWATARFEYKANCAIAERMLNAPLAALDSKPLGHRLEQFAAVDTVRDYYGGQVAQNVIDLPFMVMFFALIALIGGELVLVPVTVALLCGVCIFFVGRRLNRSLDARSTIDDRRYSFVVEVLNAIENVKGLALEAPMVRRYERLLAGSAAHSGDIAYLGAMTQAAGSIGANGAMIGLACLGAFEVLNGTMSIGALGACTLLAGRSVQPLTRAIAIWTQYQSITLARGRVDEALSLPSEDGLSPDRMIAGTPVSQLFGDIKLDELSFGYGDGKPLIDNMNLHVRPQDFVAISGGSGAGKTTLLHLIMGLGEPRQGQIRFDDIPLRQLGSRTVRASIAYLPQRPVLFRGTLRENLIQFGDGDVEARAVSLANELGLNEVIARLPDGLETWIGDDMSYALPSGVRQKIAIIRALVADPPIILFDEANSNFDQDSDTLLAALLDSFRGKKTIILVSHRPSLLHLADRHYQLADGLLTETENAVGAR